MEANSTNNKSFQLTEDGSQLGELVYENSFTQMKAEIKLPNSEVYKILPAGFFGTSITVTKDGNKFAKLSMSWDGKIIITFQDNREYALKLKGIFQSEVFLENSNKENIMYFKPHFNWTDTRLNHTITYDIKNGNESKDYLLTLLGIYATNYFIATISGANSGIYGVI
jgi:hypothetical protein